MFERFTERARHVVVLAQEEARTLQQNYIGTEHLLLGLLREDEGIAARVLDSLGLSLESARAEVLRLVTPSEKVTDGQIPFTPRAKRVLELALREALALGHDYIGTEHILLGLVRDSEGVAIRVLQHFDADTDKVRNQVIHLLPRSEGQGHGRATAAAQTGELRFIVGADRELRRLLKAAAGRALTDQRNEFGLADLLAAVDETRDRPGATDADRPPEPE